MSFVGAGIVSSGGALEWCRSLVGGPEQKTIIAEAAETPAGSRGVVFLPHLGGAPAPKPDPLSRGTFVGLTTAADRGTLYRAVLEGVAMQARTLVDGMAGLAGITPLTEIRVIGGGSRNPLFLKIKANVFGRPLTVIDEPEATALGAALLGGVAAGVYRDLDEALIRLDRREHIVEPDGEAAFYDELRTRVFEQIQPGLTGVHRALASIGPAGSV
jgi:xylulokinase